MAHNTATLGGYETPLGRVLGRAGAFEAAEKLDRASAFGWRSASALRKWLLLEEASAAEVTMLPPGAFLSSRIFHPHGCPPPALPIQQYKKRPHFGPRLHPVAALQSAQHPRSIRGLDSQRLMQSLIPQSSRDRLFQFPAQPLRPRKRESHLSPRRNPLPRQIAKNPPCNPLPASTFKVKFRRNRQRRFHQCRVQKRHPQLHRVRHAEHVRVAQQLIARIKLQLQI